MIIIGKVHKFNGRFGTIVNQQFNIHFEYKDISPNNTINVGDIVSFRIEKKRYGIYLARNIKKIQYNGIASRTSNTSCYRNKLE